MQPHSQRGPLDWHEEQLLSQLRSLRVQYIHITDVVVQALAVHSIEDPRFSCCLRPLTNYGTGHGFFGRRFWAFSACLQSLWMSRKTLDPAAGSVFGVQA